MASEDPAGTMRARPTIAELIGVFSSEMASHVTAYRNVNRFLRFAHTGAAREFNKVLQEHGVAVDGDDAGRYSVTGVFENLQLRRAQRRIADIETAQAITPVSIFLGLYSRYEALANAVVSHCVRLAPERFVNTGSTYCYERVVAAGSLDGFRESVVAELTDDLNRRSPYDLMKYFRGSHKLDIDLNSVWPRFIEVSERRNCLAHNGGRVSSQYITNTQAAGYKHAENPGVGDELPLGDEYFTMATRVLLEVGVVQAFALARHFEGDHVAQALSDAVTDAAIDLMRIGLHDAALAILRSAMVQIGDGLDAATHMVYQINIAQAEKWAGRHGACRATLDKIDWSGAADRFQFAVRVLKDDLGGAESMMIRACGEGEGLIAEGALLDWPLFREFRKTEHFRRGYECVFGRMPHPNVMQLTDGSGTREALPGEGEEDGEPDVHTVLDDVRASEVGPDDQSPAHG